MILPNRKLAPPLLQRSNSSITRSDAAYLKPRGPLNRPQAEIAHSLDQTIEENTSHGDLGTGEAVKEFLSQQKSAEEESEAHVLTMG